jgi:hypothetical protein
MDKYLVVITTILVLTQIIRVTQNAMQLRKMDREYKKKYGEGEQ